MPIQSVTNVSQGQVYSSSGNAGGDVAAEVRSVGTPQNSTVAPVAQQSASAAQQNVSASEVRNAANDINNALQTLTSSNLQFSVDNDTGQTIVRVVNVDTKEVIRQIPNEEAVAIAKSIDKLQGLIIRQKA